MYFDLYCILHPASPHLLLLLTINYSNTQKGHTQCFLSTSSSASHFLVRKGLFRLIISPTKKVVRVGYSCNTNKNNRWEAVEHVRDLDLQPESNKCVSSVTRPSFCVFRMWDSISSRRNCPFIHPIKHDLLLIETGAVAPRTVIQSKFTLGSRWPFSLPYVV